MPLLPLSSSYDAWWRGIAAWYNQGDYAHAMQLWTSQDDDLTYNHPSVKNVRDPASLLEALKQHHPEGVEFGGTGGEDGGDDPQRQQQRAKFLIFLAGCYLDAQDFSTARRYLYDSLLLLLQQRQHQQQDVCGGGDAGDGAASHNNNTWMLLLEDAVEELLASFQEDPAVPEHWIWQRQFVEWAIIQSAAGSTNTAAPQQQQLKWRNPWQRPAFPYRHC